MPIVIKEMHVRTVVERRIVTEAELTEEMVTEAELTEEMLRKIENRVVERLSARESGQPDTRRLTKRKNER